MKIEEHIDATRVLHAGFVGDDTPFEVYDRLAQGTLAAIGAPVEICQIYSVQRKAEQVTLGGSRFLVLDCGLTDALCTLDALVTVSSAADFVAMGFQRLIAEACRHARLYRQYAFFVHRALEVRQYLGQIAAAGRGAGGGFWRDAAIVGHEAAHALPEAHKLTETLGLKAQLIVSEALTAATRSLNGDLLDVLGQAPTPAAADAVREWSAFKGDLGITSDDIQSTFLGICDDMRFRGEVACDQFALTLISMFVQSQRPELEERAYVELATAALKATQRTYLNMRLLSYVDGMARLVAAGPQEGKVNPLKMQALCEFSLRGNIATRTLMDAWHEMSDRSALAPTEDAVIGLLSEAQEQHTLRLFEPLNALFEMTLLDEAFEASLDDRLRHDGLDGDALRRGDLSAVMAIDHLWLDLVRTAAGPERRGGL